MLYDPPQEEEEDICSFLKGHFIVWEEIQTKFKKNTYFPSLNKHAILRENQVPRTPFEARIVAGSATYKQSKTNWNWQFIYLVCSGMKKAFFFWLHVIPMNYTVHIWLVLLSSAFLMGCKPNARRVFLNAPELT